MESSSPSPTRTNGFAGHVVGLGVLVVCVLVAGWLIINRQYVLDQLTVWQYRPSSEVQTIASNAQLSDHGRFYFYASQPEIDGASAFNEQCQKQEEHSAILGCYTMRRIYVYDVANDQLEGIKEVTAAHEMLHAAWDRLSDAERNRITPLLEAAYTKVATDEFKERMAYYDRTQPGERANELHSIIGTEVAGLGTELEQYYAHYFTNRAQVVAFHQRYQKVFNDLDAKVKTLQAELQQLDKEVKEKMTAYESRRVQLQQMNSELQAQSESLDRSDAAAVSAYNVRVNEFNAAITALKADFQVVTGMITAYNQKVVEYNSVAFSQSTLQKSIDSSEAPIAPSI
ncbi:MAG: hypothetical protein JWM00_799 [Candidatus Saccharibacteria bacterium]|nr:hypothetical protein [Candidatus Saccharibacteria bacterium]